MIYDKHLVIGVDESSCTEEFDTNTIVTLCSLGIIRLCETVDHGDVILNGRKIATMRTLIYRKA